MNGETKKNLKQFFIVAGTLVTIAAIVITAIAIYLYNTKDARAEEKRLRENQYAINAIKNRAEITLPDDAEIVFNIKQVIFQDGTEYYVVFKFTEEPIKWLKDNNFSNSKTKALSTRSIIFLEAADGWMKTFRRNIVRYLTKNTTGLKQGGYRVLYICLIS